MRGSVPGGEDTYWVPVSSEVRVPEPLSEDEFDALSRAFDQENPESPWSRAARELGLRPGTAPLLRLVGGVACFNASALTRIVSHGTMRLERGEGGKPRYRSSRNPINYFNLFIGQGRLEGYLQREESGVRRPVDAVQESICLGLAIQSLLLRLPLHGERELAAWLAAPAAAPVTFRRSLERLRSLQRRRNELSPAWEALFRNQARPAPPRPAQAFWNEPVPEDQEPGASSQRHGWQGIPIVPGTAEGAIHFIDNRRHNPDSSRLPEGKLILAFARARPETVELFPRAEALLFAEGGALAHACCVAREMGIPCISGLGKDFLERCHSSPRLRGKLDGGSGWLELLP